MMNSDRIKEIQNKCAYPNSNSVAQALMQVWNECEQSEESLTAKLEAATTALESIATHSDGIPGDEGDDAFYDYCEVKDLAAATLKSIKEK